MTLTPKPLLACSLVAALIVAAPGFPATQALAGVVAGEGQGLAVSGAGQARGAGALNAPAARGIAPRLTLPGAALGAVAPTQAERPQAAAAADVATAIANDEAVRTITSQDAGVSDATRVSAMTKIYDDDRRVAPIGAAPEVAGRLGVAASQLAASPNRGFVHRPTVLSQWRDRSASRISAFSIGGALADPNKAALIGGLVGLISMVVGLPIFGLKSLVIPAVIGLLIGGATGFSARSDSRAASVLQSASLVGGVAGLIAGLATFHSSHLFMSLLNLGMSVGTGVTVPPLLAKLRQAVGSQDSTVGNVAVSALAGMVAGVLLPIWLTADAFRQQSAKGVFDRFKDGSASAIDLGDPSNPNNAYFKDQIAVTFKAGVSKQEISAFFAGDVAAGMKVLYGPDENNGVLLRLPEGMTTEQAKSQLIARDFSKWIVSVDLVAMRFALGGPSASGAGPGKAKPEEKTGAKKDVSAGISAFLDAAKRRDYAIAAAIAGILVFVGHAVAATVAPGLFLAGIIGFDLGVKTAIKDGEVGMDAIFAGAVGVFFGVILGGFVGVTAFPVAAVLPILAVYGFGSALYSLVNTAVQRKARGLDDAKDGSASSIGEPPAAPVGPAPHEPMDFATMEKLLKGYRVLNSRRIYTGGDENADLLRQLSGKKFSARGTVSAVISGRLLKYVRLYLKSEDGTQTVYLASGGTFFRRKSAEKYVQSLPTSLVDAKFMVYFNYRLVSSGPFLVEKLEPASAGK